MKVTCNTIQDLLPLLVEDLVSEDTKKLLIDHIENCPKCKKEYEELKSAKLDCKSKNELESIPLKNINKKLKKRNTYTGLIASLIITLILVVGLNIATKPIPLSYQKAVESIEVEGSKIFIKFMPEVSNYSIIYTNHDSRPDYEIMAWKNKISNLFEKSEAKTLAIDIGKDKNLLVKFVSQGLELDEIIYGNQEGYGITLPRLAMNYYLKLMTILFLISGALSFIFRKLNKISKVTKSIMIFTFSYMLSHIAIFGMGGPTYHMIRDFTFVIITTILTFSILILLIYKKNFLNK